MAYQVEKQVGGQSGHSTIDQVFLLHHLGGMLILLNKTLYHIFVDFTKAFDSVWREGLWGISWSIGLNTKVVRLLKELYRGAKNMLRVQNKLSD